MDLPNTLVVAFILAGGKSRRMGADKAFLEVAGRPLIEHAVALARSATNEVRIVGNPAKFASFADTIPDVFAARGPLAGIHAALSASQADCNLILGVDLPFIEKRFLKYLVDSALSNNALVTVPSSGGHLQTLCAVYRRPFLEFAVPALEEGRNKIDALFPEMMVNVIPEEELTSAGFSAAMFRNLNTLEDLEAAQREFQSRQRL